MLIRPHSLASPGQWLLRYAAAVAVVAASALVRWWLNPVLGDSSPYLLFMPGVLLIALLCGLGPGLFATVLSSAAGVYFWIGPTFSFTFASNEEMVHALASLVVGAAISVISDRMRRAQQAQRRANAAKDQFLAMLSHELRQPLAPMSAAVDTLRQQLSGQSGFEETLGILSRNLSLHSRLIADLLDVNRIAAGKLNLQRQTCELKLIVSAACDDCLPKMREKMVNFHSRLPPEPCWIEADPARIQQVVWNLLRNATKFTPPGGTIELDLTRGNQQFSVTVRDTGIGIAPEKLPRLFDAFEQAHGELSTRLGGLGLGLAICRGVAKAHGGEIRAQSDGPGKGATFTLLLPTGAPGVSISRPAADAAPSPAPGSVRILLVEDQPDTRRLLAGLLRRAGYQVATAQSVEAATKATDNIDLLISDMTLPDGTGADVLQRLGARRPAKAICLSGAGSPEEVSRNLRGGFARHLTKPVSFDQLQQTINEVLA